MGTHRHTTRVTVQRDNRQIMFEKKKGRTSFVLRHPFPNINGRPLLDGRMTTFFAFFADLTCSGLFVFLPCDISFFDKKRSLQEDRGRCGHTHISKIAALVVMFMARCPRVEPLSQQEVEDEEEQRIRRNRRRGIKEDQRNKKKSRGGEGRGRGGGVTGRGGRKGEVQEEDRQQTDGRSEVNECHCECRLRRLWSSCKNFTAQQMTTDAGALQEGPDEDDE